MCDTAVTKAVLATRAGAWRSKLHTRSVQKRTVTAAITATLAVSITISAKSKPAKIGTFDMGTSLEYPDTER
jgi:hypothetical protein